MRPPFETFKGATYKGCYALCTACGRCEKCAWERTNTVQNGKDDMELQPHQQRVVAEKKELDVKRDRLTEFLKGPAPNFVGAEELERLTRQLSIMGDYSNILAERITHF